MDPTTAVRTDTLPAIATVVAPGAFGSAPYAWAALSHADGVREFLDHHEAIAVAATVLIWIVAGLLIESLGSYVEVYFIDHPRPDHSKMLENWWRFLRSSWKTEPIGLHYLRRMLVSFKFELNMSVAAMTMTPGFAILAFRGDVGPLTTFFTIGLCFAAAAGLFSMAETSAKVLADVRAQLIEELERRGPFE